MWRSFVCLSFVVFLMSCGKKSSPLQFSYTPAPKPVLSPLESKLRFTINSPVQNIRTASAHVNFQGECENGLEIFVDSRDLVKPMQFQCGETEQFDVVVELTSQSGPKEVHLWYKLKNGMMMGHEHKLFLVPTVSAAEIRWQKAKAVLDKFCIRCHGGRHQEWREYKQQDFVENFWIEVNQPEKSFLLEETLYFRDANGNPGLGRMPLDPDLAKQFTQADYDILYDWVKQFKNFE